MSEAEASVVEAVERSTDLTDQYTLALDGWVNERVPTCLSNEEYAARCSALMIALNRQLARCAAAFGQANNVEPDAIRTLILGQLSRNYRTCIDALEGKGSAVQ